METKWRLIFWGTTGIFCLMMLGSATMYFVSEEVAKTFKHLGFTDSFRVELGIAKYLGVIALILPMVPKNVKEWAYAGFGITLISAAIAHSSAGDPVDAVITPLVALGILSTSYLARSKMNQNT